MYTKPISLVLLLLVTTLVDASPAGVKPFLKSRDCPGDPSNISANNPNVFCFRDRGDMNKAGTDQSAEALKNWAATGATLASKDHNQFVGADVNGATVYACTDGQYGSNGFTAEDVNTALAIMDAKCNAYEASYYIWPNSNKIIGKDKTGIPICQDFFTADCNGNQIH